MRKSLFDNYAPQIQRSPRLQPNVFARLARFSFNRAIAVLFFWAALAVASSLWSVSQTQPAGRLHLSFTAASKSQTYLTALDQNFPNLNSLTAINMSNPDPAKLKQARAQFVSALEPQTEIFDLVFAPGTGSYYDTHSILYHSLDDVKARIAYAKSLEPLFTAVATAPTTQSLATLVNEVSASIELGRDPQGLDQLFSEAAQAVQALMMGVERPVDWTTVAGLNVEPLPNSVLVFVVPKSGQYDKAIALINDSIAAMPPDDGTTTIVDQPVQNEPKSITSDMPTSNWPAVAMAMIFLIFILVAALGQFTLAMMVALPVVCIIMVLSGPLRFMAQGIVVQFWPALLAVAVLVIQMAARLSFLSVETLETTRSKESAVMLAAQKQGWGLSWQVFAAVLIWSCWFAINEAAFTRPLCIIIAAMALGFLVTLTAVPALVAALPMAAKWRASEWLEPLHEALFDNRGWRSMRNILAVVAVAAAASGLWLTPKVLALQNQTAETQSAVNILASSAGEAEAIVKALKSVKQAQSVRWLGAFLPQQVEEKQLALKELKDQFPRITPLVPQSPELLREHIAALQDSLLAITNSSATRNELRAAAATFRQSLELLAATSADTEVMALENRVFGSFNVLVERADAMAGLDRPNLQTLDPRLKSLFLSERNFFRMEVTPVAGLSNAKLARLLAGQGFHVAHPVVVADEAAQVQQRAIYVILGTALALALLALIFASGEIIGFIGSSFTLATCLGCIILGLAQMDMLFTPEIVLAITALGVFATSVIGMAFQKKQMPGLVRSNAFYAVEAWLPVALLIALVSPFILLKSTDHSLVIGSYLVASALSVSLSGLVLRPLIMLLRGS